MIKKSNKKVGLTPTFLTYASPETHTGSTCLFSIGSCTTSEDWLGIENFCSSHGILLKLDSQAFSLLPLFF